MTEKKPFWLDKSLDEMSPDQWESLCDGCGKCCLHKLEDEDTGDVHYTNVACRLLNIDTIRCDNYPMRKRFVPDCINLNPEKLKTINWLPETCAYLLLHEGKPLPQWHHLISGSYDTVHEIKKSIKGKIVSEKEASDLHDHIVDDGVF